jgi:D-alanyl-D-alanine carboxypeptidase
VLAALVIAAGVGLWATWDSTQTSTSNPLAPTPELLALATTSTTAATTTTTLPPCSVGDEPVEGDPRTDWATLVIDTAHSLPPDYAPGDLVDVTAAGFAQRDQVREIVVPDLAALRQAAQANGTPLVLVSGYRSYEYQRGLFQDRARQVGEAQAAAGTARPGHSEHQLGTAIDVLNPESGDLTTDFATTPAGQWVEDHAHEFGFVVSYPDAARDRTCYEFEPWHLRYVGREIAVEIHESGLSPREWMIVSRDRRAG